MEVKADGRENLILEECETFARFPNVEGDASVFKRQNCESWNFCFRTIGGAAPCSNGVGEVEYIVDNKYIWKNYLRSRRRRRQRGETKIDHSKQCGIKQNQ